MTVVETTIIDEWVDSKRTVLKCSNNGKLVAALGKSLHWPSHHK
jgi:hypothetical protein